MSMGGDDMAEYFRMFVEETGEQLDALVEIMLRLEAAPDDRNLLAEAFRMIHSIKGSSALLGLEQTATSTPADVSPAAGAPEATQEDTEAETAPSVTSPAVSESEAEPVVVTTDAVPPTASPPPASPEPAELAGPCRVILRLRPELPMAEMKVELLLARLAAVGTILTCDPPREQAVQMPTLRELSVSLAAGCTPAEIEQAADVDGIEEFRIEAVADQVAPCEHPPAATGNTPSGPPPAPDVSRSPAEQAVAASVPTSPLSATIRVDVDRLDVLLNLTGELVVNRARLAQLAGDIAPAFRKSHLTGGSAVETLRGLLADEKMPQKQTQLMQLADDLESLEHQLQGWGEARGRFTELLEAVDQLTRVSSSLQRGVLETRMVPVGPLFGRFKRSVRDIANELGKKVSLELVGEKTELDKRMIDEIGDPLNHLIRNSIDHGIESAATRAAAGKPEVATVRLTASHRGNNVFITVEDDGGGIDSDRVRRTAVERGLLSQVTADTLADGELHELIWQPGFSTAAKVSDISGRGVGMDIVRTKIVGLNGSIEVDSRRGEGTCFTIRLPLTLTIARCMLFRVAEGVFGVPIENVREIVSARGLRTVPTGGRTLADIRGEMLPLVGIHDLFHWSTAPGGGQADAVIVLQSGHRLLGLRADALLGGQDVVIKPLDENFLHVRGLGGASVLGDGSVCLLLDTASCIDLAQQERGSHTDAMSRSPQAT